MSSSSAIGVIIASGNMGKTLAIKNNVFVSADAGLSWHQILKGSHYFNMGDHGGELFASFFFCPLFLSLYYQLFFYTFVSFYLKVFLLLPNTTKQMDLPTNYCIPPMRESIGKI